METVFAFQDFLARSGTASPRTGTWHSANNKAIQEFLKRRGYLEMRTYSVGADLEADEEVVRGMEAWLRDQGFPCGLQGNEADGVDGVIHSATRLALQLFLNSERAGQIDKDLVIDGKWKEPTIRRLQELLVEDNPNVEVNGLWDIATRQGLQLFLRLQGRYVSFTDGDFGAVSVESLQAWLRDEAQTAARKRSALPGKPSLPVFHQFDLRHRLRGLWPIQAAWRGALLATAEGRPLRFPPARS